MRTDLMGYLTWLFGRQCVAVPDAVVGVALVLVGLGAACACVAVFLRWFLVPVAREWEEITAPYESMAPHSFWSVLQMVTAVTMAPTLEEVLFNSWAIWLWATQGAAGGLAACAVAVWLQWAGHRYEPVAWAVKGAIVPRPAAMARMHGVRSAFCLASGVATGSLIPGIIAHTVWNVLADLWDLGVIDAHRVVAYARSLAPVR